MMYSKGNKEDKKRFWIVKVNEKGFECAMLIYGVEGAMWKYMRSELGYIPDYHEVSDEDANMMRKIGMKGYIC